MKKIFLFISALFFASQINAQINLVPNPSFEDTSGLGGYYPKQWQYINETPDYFSNLNSNNWSPNNPFGFQYPNNGNAYCGILSFESQLANYREIIGVQLIDSLKIGKKYFVSFKTSLSNCFNCATNKLGMLFSVNSTTFNSSTIWQNNAKIFSVNKVADTLNWVSIEGSFLADSNYQFIYLGHFFTNNNIDTFKLHNGICNSTGQIYDCESYYYLDDICVSSDSATCNIPTKPMFVHNELGTENFVVFPSPVNSILNVNGISCGSYIIQNIVGEIESFGVIEKNNFQIDVSNYRNGIHFLVIKKNNSKFYNKILIQH
jgi:hypothetical protein